MQCSSISNLHYPQCTLATKWRQSVEAIYRWCAASSWATKGFMWLFHTCNHTLMCKVVFSFKSCKHNALLCYTDQLYITLYWYNEYCRKKHETLSVYSRPYHHTCTPVISGWGGRGARQWAACVRLGRRWAASSRSGVAPLPSSFARSRLLAFSPKPAPPHQNTPNGKKIWLEGGGGWRPAFTVLHRAR